MEEFKTEKKIILPLLSNITIVGILVYYLGWKYWEGYYNFFSIQTSLIEISFEKIIITTWSKLVGLSLIFIVFWEDFWKDKNNEYPTGPSIIAIIIVMVAQSDYEYTWLILLISVSIFFGTILILRKRNFKFSSISRLKFLAILTISIYIFGIFYYAKNGRKDAEKFYSKFEDNIEITLTDKSLITGKYLTFMNGKYFLITEDVKCEKHTIAIEESQVIIAEFK